jgi:hypothetical protein
MPENGRLSNDESLKEVIDPDQSFPLEVVPIPEMEIS